MVAAVDSSLRVRGQLFVSNFGGCVSVQMKKEFALILCDFIQDNGGLDSPEIRELYNRIVKQFEMMGVIQ